jgi:hypothetical protein
MPVIAQGQCTWCEKIGLIDMTTGACGSCHQQAARAVDSATVHGRWPVELLIVKLSLLFALIFLPSFGIGFLLRLLLVPIFRLIGAAHGY